MVHGIQCPLTMPSRSGCNGTSSRAGLLSLGRSVNQAMLNLKTAVSSLLLTMVIGGCGSPTESPSSAIAKPNSQSPVAGNTWVTSDDGKLALRLSVMTPRVKANGIIQVAAEIRNASQQKITILRPFGDRYAASTPGMKMWDGERQIGYTGPAVTYVIGSSAFAVIGPGEVVEDKLELGIDNFAGMESPGRYTLRYDYSYDGYWDTTAAAGNSGIKDAWRGTISSREVQVFRE